MYWAEVWKYLEPEQREAMERNPTLKAIISERLCLKKHLSIDPNRYDRYSYHRLQLRTRMCGEREKYLSLTIPYIDEIVDDLTGDGSTFMSSSTRELPPTVSLIFNHYICNPSPLAIIPLAETLRLYTRALNSLVQGVVDHVTRSDLVIMPYPLIYTVHVDPLGLDRNRYVAVMWYGHICLNDGDHDGDSKKTRQIYRVMEYPYTSDEPCPDPRTCPIVKDILLKNADVLTGNAARHWLGEAQSMSRAFDELVKHYPG